MEKEIPYLPESCKNPKSTSRPNVRTQAVPRRSIFPLSLSVHVELQRAAGSRKSVFRDGQPDIWRKIQDEVAGFHANGVTAATISIAPCILAKRRRLCGP